MDTIERIVVLAKKRGLTQDALERAAGLSENRISKWKNDPNADPKFSELRRMAEVLRISVGYLIGETEDEGVASLDADEQAAVGFYRQLRTAIGASGALMALAKLAACPKEPGPEKPHGPAVFIARQNLTESRAQRDREEKAPKKAGGKPGKGKAKAAGGG